MPIRAARVRRGRRPPRGGRPLPAARIATVSQQSALTKTYSRIGFSLRRLLANSLTTEYAAPFHQLLDECLVVYKTELDLNDQIDEKKAEASACDEQLNHLARRVSKEALTLTGEKTDHKLYKHFFGDKPLNVFIRPTLGEQLDEMAGWVPALKGSEHVRLKELGVELEPVITKAQGLVTAAKDARQALDDFRNVGARKAFIDKVNAVRKETYGLLSTLPHKHVGLPLNFADQFFQRETRSDREEAKIEKTEATISELRAKLAEQEQLLDELKEEQRRAQAKAEAQVKAEAQAKLETELLNKQKELLALKAQIEPQAPNPTT